MNKHEILEQSRKDGGFPDERLQLMHYRISHVMVGAMLTMWALLFVWDALHGVDTSVGGAIGLSGVAAMNLSQFYQLRTKSSLAFGVLAALGALAFAGHHIMLTL